ncbi:MAG: hypothetical protein WC690_07435 [bacterium]
MTQTEVPAFQDHLFRNAPPAKLLVMKPRGVPSGIASRTDTVPENAATRGWHLANRHGVELRSSG